MRVCVCICAALKIDKNIACLRVLCFSRRTCKRVAASGFGPPLSTSSPRDEPPPPRDPFILLLYYCYCRLREKLISFSLMIEGHSEGEAGKMLFALRCTAGRVAKNGVSAQHTRILTQARCMATAGLHMLLGFFEEINLYILRATRALLLLTRCSLCVATVCFLALH